MPFDFPMVILLNHVRICIAVATNYMVLNSICFSEDNDQVNVSHQCRHWVTVFEGHFCIGHARDNKQVSLVVSVFDTAQQLFSLLSRSPTWSKSCRKCARL